MLLERGRKTTQRRITGDSGEAGRLEREFKIES